MLFWCSDRALAESNSWKVNSSTSYAFLQSESKSGLRLHGFPTALTRSGAILEETGKTHTGEWAGGGDALFLLHGTRRVW